MKEVYDGETLISGFFFCTNCKQVIFCEARKDGNINALTRYECSQDVNGKKKILVKPGIREEMKNAATKFVVNDLRPFYAIEGESLLQLCTAVMHFGQFGQTYPKACPDDLKTVLPSRNTVRKFG